MISYHCNSPKWCRDMGAMVLMGLWGWWVRIISSRPKWPSTIQETPSSKTWTKARSNIRALHNWWQMLLNFRNSLRIDKLLIIHWRISITCSRIWPKTKILLKIWVRIKKVCLIIWAMRVVVREMMLCLTDCPHNRWILNKTVRAIILRTTCRLQMLWVKWAASLVIWTMKYTV